MNAVKLNTLKKGQYFTRKPTDNPTQKQVYIRDDYDRTEKKYCCIRFDDIGRSISLKGSTLVYIDFIF